MGVLSSGVDPLRQNQSGAGGFLHIVLACTGQVVVACWAASGCIMLKYSKTRSAATILLFCRLPSQEGSGITEPIMDWKRQKGAGFCLILSLVRWEGRSVWGKGDRGTRDREANRGGRHGFICVLMYIHCRAANFKRTGRSIQPHNRRQFMKVCRSRSGVSVGSRFSRSIRANCSWCSIRNFCRLSAGVGRLRGETAPPTAILRRLSRSGCREPALSATAEEPPARKTYLTAPADDLNRVEREQNP